MSGLKKVFLLLVIVLAAVGSVVGWQAMRFINTPVSEDSTAVVFEVRSGQSIRDVAAQLEQQHLISDARKFRIYSRFLARAGRVRVGEYALKRNMTPGEILKVLASGRSIEYVVTVSEGLNRFEIAGIVQELGIGTKQEFLSLTQDRTFIQQTLGDDVPSLEGYLFPETYYVTRASGVRSLLKQMVTKFKEKFALVQYGSEIAVPLTKHQLVTLASIVEKETAAPEERPVISSVFHNRLKKGMRLQTDPTVIYGMWLKTGEWNRNISRQDLIAPTPYNTYVIYGLPPGPIANPGLQAMQAAARPAQSEFYFFVSRNDGTHVFSREYGQHRNAVVEYQLDKKARAGKSWRDLKGRQNAPAAVQEATVKKSAPAPMKTTSPKSRNNR